ncbi:MAG TPA: SpoIID/LytB domain-containing protein [Candidatus Moranbacteria bacterium]|nr:SpoIID/LytB domain-containing protein [Candidatus Moranbacteria bacterium]HRZ33327.1 SpoIID/LytB domain-containing protein [Candidatus Moranbacteria bacterium]
MKKIIVLSIFASFLTFFYLDIKSAEASVSPSPVYAFWSKSRTFRYMTISESEKTSLLKNSDFESEGILFYAYLTKQINTTPVYKIYGKKYLYYYYTTSKEKRDSLIKDKAKWTDQGIAFYAYANDSQKDTVPVYALKNLKNNKYFYTTSTEEKSSILTDSDWTDKGTFFWVPEKNADVSEDSTTSKDESVSQTNYGPEIAVGLWSYSKDDLEDESFKIDANKDYVIKDKDGKKIAEIKASSTTRVKYTGDKNLRVYNSIEEKELNREVSFESKDGNNSNLIFDVNRPDSSYDEYRGKIKIKYNSTDGRIWVINTLPMEQYTWGMGETTGTGPFEHTKVMTTIFRTYGYWYKENATKYLPYGFTLRSDSGSQIYRGYEWEEKYPNIKKAAENTKGIIVKYKDEVALTPYCSWSDGYTRRYEDGHWGGYKNISDYKEKASKVYPWLDSVKDPYGKHSSYSTKTLANSGNHMVGLIANGSVKLAGESYKKTYDWILKYYYDDISLKKMY